MNTRYEEAQRALRRRHLECNPDMLPEAVARHYLSMMSLAQDLSLLSRVGAPAAPAVERHILETIRAKHVEDFGCEPAWFIEPAEKDTPAKTLPSQPL